MSIDLKHLRYAEAAARCGSFRKAADLLALKQSNLSRRVRHLEEQLGIALFERTNGGVQGLQRDWLHTDQGYVHFPDTKTDGQVRAIGPSAAQLAAGQPARKNCPYVFASDVRDGHFTAAKSCLARLCATAKIEGVTPHTLRHTFGSVAGDLGFSELTIAALLGHAAKGGTQGYVYIDEALKLAATRTCEEIASHLGAGLDDPMAAREAA